MSQLCSLSLVSFPSEFDNVGGVNVWAQVQQHIHEWVSFLSNVTTMSSELVSHSVERGTIVPHWHYSSLTLPVRLTNLLHYLDSLQYSPNAYVSFPSECNSKVYSVVGWSVFPLEKVR